MRKCRAIAAVGPLATIRGTRKSRSSAAASSSGRSIFYHDHPRIDFETEITDIPDKTVVVAEFPLAEVPSIVRRGIPFGFATESTGQATADAPGVGPGH